MKGFDAFAGVIKSGGKTRRAAKMIILDVDHPDIMEFVECKGSEERKAWALIDAGYDAALDGEAYALGVLPERQSLGTRLRRVHERGRPGTTTSGTPSVAFRRRACPGSYSSQGPDRQDRLVRPGQCGDPGMQFDDTINRWHTCKATDRIYASNPCSEFMFLDETACNLASLNLHEVR